MLNLLLTARARRTSGPEQTGLEGHGGGHRGKFGDEESIPQLVKRTSLRSRSLIGRSSGQHTSQWSEQSGHRNAFYPAAQVFPGLQARIYQDKYPGLVEVLAVGPAGVGDAPGNGRGVR